MGLCQTAVPRDHPGMSTASTTTAIYEAAQELHAMGTEITRHTIAELTQLPTVVVDDRLRALAEDGRIKRLVRGVYAVVKQYPPTRPMSKTVLADGFVKIEIGDEVLTLTPREDRVLGGLMAGSAFVAASTAHEARLADALARLQLPVGTQL